MDDRESIIWLLEVMYWLRLLSHGEPCQKQDRAEVWLRSHIKSETRQSPELPGPYDGWC